MVYEVSCLLRFDSKRQRDIVFALLKRLSRKLYPTDDNYVEKHLCYHDEGNETPCILEEHAPCKAQDEITPALYVALREALHDAESVELSSTPIAPSA